MSLLYAADSVLGHKIQLPDTSSSFPGLFYVFCNTENTEVTISTFLRQYWKTIRRNQRTVGHRAVSVTVPGLHFSTCWHGFLKSLILLIISLLPYCVTKPHRCGAQRISVMTTEKPSSCLL